MLALLAAIGIFLFFGIVGYALVTVTAGYQNEMLTLVSPALGVAVVTLLTMFLNYLGAPVKSLGFPLAVALLATSIGIVIRSKTRRFPRSLYVIAAVLLGALMLSGWPFLEFGFDWVSYANGDMSTYVYGATRMFEHGFLVFPDPNAYVQNREAIETLYGLDVLYDNRTGAENVLAFVMALLHLDGYRAYMPLMLAFHLMLISAATALAFVRSKGLQVPLAICLLLSVSALTTLGTEYQLLAQVPGLALLAVSLILICAPIRCRSAAYFVRRACLCAVALAGLEAIYPEIVPFLGLAVLMFFGLSVRRKAVSIAESAKWVGAVVALAAAFLNFHLSTFWNMLSVSLSFEQSAGMAGSFPDYLVPSGIANLFGLTPVASPASEPWQSLAIAAGLFLLAFAVLGTILMITRGEVAAFGCFAFLLGGVLLFHHQNGFGLYKLAMYLQPFLIPTVVIWWADRHPSASGSRA
jgi:hypothetical protein